MGIVRSAAIILLASFLAIFTIWGALALHFRLPGPEWLGLVISGFFVLLGLVAMGSVLRRKRAPALWVFGLASILLVGWWYTITPPKDLNWAADVSRQSTGQIDGDLVTITDIRDFQWRAREDFDANWITKTYDLSQLETLDLFLSYWGSPYMAHFILSFGFSDGEYLAWSIEVRREIGGTYSPVADAFREHTLVILAVTEPDVVGVRSNIRGEDVQLYRLATNQDEARRLFEEYVRDANKLAEQPYWYNSITTNCTTVVFKMMDAIGNGTDFDWRMIVNGFLPEYAYEKGHVNTKVSLDELRDLGRIAPRAKRVGLSDGFSQAIRESVPTPDVETLGSNS